jgi:hypothetical protein
MEWRGLLPCRFHACRLGQLFCGHRDYGNSITGAVDHYVHLYSRGRYVSLDIERSLLDGGIAYQHGDPDNLYHPAPSDYSSDTTRPDNYSKGIHNRFAGG